MLKIATITGGINQPSSNFRIRQFIGKNKLHEIVIHDFLSKKGKYPPKGKIKRVFWIIEILLERLIQVIKINRSNYDCVIIQREMVSTLHTFERFIKSPKILDVDDAIYLHRNGKFIQSIAKNCSAVICGNIFLENKFSSWNKNTFIIPTPVDTKKFKPRDNCKKSSDKITIGWIGTSSGFEYLYKIEKAINHVLNKFSNVEFIVVSDSKPKFNLLDKYIFVKWIAECQVENLHKFDIGIMPLENNEWSRGKCSYKMLQYMSCGIPVVVSPVGMNNEVLAKGDIGYGAEGTQDWIKYLEKVISSANLRSTLGQNGRKVVVENYSLEISALLFKNAIENTLQNNR